MFERKEKILQVLQELQEQHKSLKHEFFKRTENCRTNYHNQITQARNKYLDNFFSKSSVLSPMEVFNNTLLKEVKEYTERCDWDYIDPIILMGCLERIDDMLIEKMAKVGLLYQAFRIIDDVLDNHVDYKGEYPTLYGNIKKIPMFSKHVLAVSNTTSDFNDMRRITRHFK